jgi:hypothetical protein
MVLVAVGLAASPAPAWIRLAMPLAAAGLAVAVGVRPVTATALAVLALAAGLSGQARLEALGVADPGQALTGPVHGLVTLLESPRESPFGTSAPAAPPQTSTTPRFCGSAGSPPSWS